MAAAGVGTRTYSVARVCLALRAGVAGVNGKPTDGTGSMMIPHVIL